MSDLERMRKYVGGQFDYDNLICCMTDKVGVNVEVKDTGVYNQFQGFGRCRLYEFYYDIKDSDLYEVWVSQEDEIVDIRVLN